MPASFSIDDLLLLNHEILAIARAKAPLAPELAAAAKQMPNRASLLAQTISIELSKGRPLDEALVRLGPRLPGFYTSVVRAGVKTGRLTSALESLTGALERKRSLRQQLLLSLTYPLAITAAAWVLLVLTAHNLGTMFDWVSLESRPWIASLVVEGPWFWALLLSVPAATLMLTTFAWLGARQSSRVSNSALGLSSWMPGVRRVSRYTAYAHFAELLRLMLGNQTPLPEALRSAGEAVDCRALSLAADEVANRIAQGERPNSAEAKGLPPLVRLSLLSATPGHDPALSLWHAASYYRERSLVAQTALNFVLPIITVAFGGLAVGAYACLVLGPYYSSLWTLSF